MRKLGYLLLIVGFASVLMQAAGRIKHAAWVAREQWATLPQQVSYSRQQVEEAIFRTALASRESDAAAVFPGALMVCGGILLGLGKQNATGKKLPHNHLHGIWDENILTQPMLQTMRTALAGKAVRSKSLFVKG